MCDFKKCKVEGPLWPCDGCPGRFCDAHADREDHGCPALQDDRRISNVVPLGRMPLPEIPELEKGELELVEEETNQLPREPLKKKRLSCGMEIAEETMKVTVAVRHRTCDAAPGSLTSLLERESRRRVTSTCRVGHDFFQELAVELTWGLGNRLVLTACGFDTGFLRFDCGEHEKEKLADLLEASSQRRPIEAKLIFKVQLISFFRPLMRCIFRRDGRRQNLSQPGETFQQELLSTLTVMEPKKEAEETTPEKMDELDDDFEEGLEDDLDLDTDEGDIELKLAATEAIEAPCTLVSLKSSGAVCSLQLEIDLEECGEKQRQELVCTLVAADLSRLAFVTGLSPSLKKICEQNCRSCFSDYFPIGRGRDLFEQLHLECGELPIEGGALAFATAVQEQIRPWITTANNWTHPCESKSKQPFQWLMARALGKIKDDHPTAAPVLFLRELREHRLIEPYGELVAAIFLQAGFGHCREFSLVTCNVLTEVTRASAPIRKLLGDVIRCEYDDEDHAFVCGGVTPRSLTKYVAKEDEDDEEIDPIRWSWDLTADLLELKGQCGWVCDPYLEKSKQAGTLWNKHASYLGEKDVEPVQDEQEMIDEDEEARLKRLLEAQERRDSIEGVLEMMRRSKPAPLLIREIGKPRLYVVVSVDWEGTNLHPVNLGCIARHRELFPQVKLTHYICPQYLCDARVEPSRATVYLQPVEDQLVVVGPESAKDWWLKELTPDTQAIGETIRAAIGPDDEAGLHIHGWKKLLRGAEVAPKHDDVDLAVGSRWGDNGHPDYLLDYSSEELYRIVKYALSLFRQLELPEPLSFRAGGWTARTELLQAVLQVGIRIDSSAVPAAYAERVSAKNEKLRQALETIWADISEVPLPRYLQVDDAWIQEVPNGCALADYVDVDTMMRAAALAVHRVLEGSSQLLHIGFHQESAAASYFNGFLQVEGEEEPVVGLIQELQLNAGYYDKHLVPVLKALTTTKKCEVVFVTVSEAAQIFLGRSDRV